MTSCSIRFSVRELKHFRTEKDFDDAEHVFSHLDNLFRIETEPELLAAYRAVADGLWANHKGDAQSLFTYIYCALAPDAPDREQPLAQALHSLQTWPVDMTMRPRMNSLDPARKPPYPVYAAAWDNEYLWKGNLLRGDGWLSRIVTDVAVPEEDPLVLYAIDTAGGLYQSRDGAASPAGWRPIDASLPSRACAIDAGPRVRMVYAACGDGFYLSLTGGHDWERLPVPSTGRPTDVSIDPLHPLEIYAVTTQGIWRSEDFGPDFIGRKWECLTSALPEAGDGLFLAVPGHPAQCYAVLDGVLFSKDTSETLWQRGAPLHFPTATQGYPWLAAHPAQPKALLSGMHGNYGEFGAFSILRHSADAGLTWDLTLEKVYETYQEGGMAALLPMLIQGEISKPAIDPASPDTLYMAAGPRGVLKSADRGKTWTGHTQGMDIPKAESVIAPRNTSWIFAGTPGGLCVSKDGGRTWEDAHLWLQFHKNERRELGGAAFIDAYWRARYYGFIDKVAAQSPYDGGIGPASRTCDGPEPFRENLSPR